MLAGQDEGLLDATLLWLAQVYSSRILVLFRYRLNGAAVLSSLDSQKKFSWGQVPMCWDHRQVLLCQYDIISILTTSPVSLKNLPGRHC